MSEDVSLKRDLDMVMLVEAKTKLLGGSMTSCSSTTSARMSRRRHRKFYDFEMFYDFETIYDFREQSLERYFVEDGMTEYVKFEDRTGYIQPVLRRVR